MFSIRITIESSEKSVIQAQSRAVFERLVKLTELTLLYFGKLAAYFQDSQEFQILNLRFDSCLGQLSSLKLISGLDFTGTIQHVGAVDVAWMGRSFKRLYGDTWSQMPFWCYRFCCL